MGKHMNPGNEAFKEALQTYYVDKTGMIALINRTINTKMKLTCISRPRRFGKSYAVQMLCAYYDCQCDSHGLFDNHYPQLSEINSLRLAYGEPPPAKREAISGSLSEGAVSEAD